MQESSSDPPSSPLHQPQDLSSRSMHSDGLNSSDDEAMEICSEEDDCRDSTPTKMSFTEENNNSATCYDLTSKREFLKSLELETSPKQYQRNENGSSNNEDNDEISPIPTATATFRSGDTMLTTPPSSTPTSLSTALYEEEQQDCFVEEFKRMKAMGEFPCRLCPEKFPNLRALKGHNRVHLMVSSPLYECNLCPYAHADRSTVVKHMKCHNGERPYECSVCKFAFTTKANCERHFRNRHRGRPREQSQQKEKLSDVRAQSDSPTDLTVTQQQPQPMPPIDDDNPLDLSIKKKPRTNLTPPMGVVPPPSLAPLSLHAHPSSQPTDPSSVQSYLGVVPPPYLVTPPVYPDLQREVLRGLQLSGGRLVPSDQVKMVVKNGVLVAKQKQRRYRTERPFGCQHCPARFTLRSNMERHVKQQHPELWSQRQRPPGGRRSNRGGSNSLVTTPSMDPASREIPMDVKTALYEQIKSRTNCQPPPITTSTATAATVTAAVAAAAAAAQDKDLASVSQMVFAASNATSLTKYFLSSSVDRVNGLDNDHSSNSSGSDERSSPNSSNESVTGGGSGGGSGGGNKGAGGGGGGGKKRGGCSAYSLAPNRVTCPFCSRQFPWSSSLRRHVLTHTGQKPYKCTSCHLLFTTKSNCDRHMSRKHSRKSSALSGAEEERDDSDKNMSTGVSVKTQTDNNNVSSSPRTSTSPTSPEHSEGVETPFKCHLCDGSFTERSSTLEHIKTAHARDYALLAAKGALDSCDETDDQDAANNDHPNRKVTCAFCLRRFWSAEDLRRHVRSHTGERPFSCHLCHRRFTLKHSMLRHLKKHNVNNNINNNNNNNNNNNINNNNNNNNDKSANSSPELSRPNDLISNLLGIQDTSIVDTMLESGPSHAARILGVDSGS